jgi:hypothetical protein
MQQINLYQPLFRQQKKIFSAVTMLQMTGFFVVVLGVIYAWNVRSLAPFQDELEKTSVEFDRLAARIEQVRVKTPGEAETRLLEQEISRLTRELKYRRELKEALAAGTFGNTDGFSGYFEALARGHVDGAWLTGIMIAQGGVQLSLTGLTIDPELVPLYIKRLAESPAFHSRGFNVLELARSQQEDQLVAFNIGTGG